jgi:transcription elongation GreA/GreB family factor
MAHVSMENLIAARDWSAVEGEWLEAVERPDVDAGDLLSVLDALIEAGQGPLASTMAWLWLTMVKEQRSPAEALQLGRALLLRLPDGEEIREEILSLYRQTHQDRPNLEAWIERSGLKSGKSVRRSLRFLEVGLRLEPGLFLVHRTENEAAQIVEFNVEKDSVVVRTARRTRSFDVAHLIEEYDLAQENDFRVLSQFQPERLPELAEQDPIGLVTGMARCHGDRLDRDALKLMLVPRYLAAEKWADWWAGLREGIKRSRHLRLEGRSPMFLVYDERGRSRESETWAAFSRTQTPREWLELLEAYLRDVKRQGRQPDAAFLERLQAALLERIERFGRHGEPGNAFATALVIERLAADGLPVTADAHGLALIMLTAAEDPVAAVAALPDARLWPLAIRCVEQASGERSPEIIAELILHAPMGQCDALARKVEEAGRGELLPMIVERATADPEQFTDATMWVWKGPSVKTALPIPPLTEMLSIVLGLVGPERTSGRRDPGPASTQMRAKVRAGLSAKDYENFRHCLDGLDLAMIQTIRRQVERAEGLGPRVQEDLGRVLYDRFPQLYVKPKVQIWEDESVLYFTQAGYDVKKAELDELVNVKMRENAKAIGAAAAHGDLSENSEYKFALEERDLLQARVAQLNREVSLARVIERHEVPGDHVSIGQRVVLQPTAGGEPVVMTILGVNDGDVDRRVFSYRTPMAGQVLGKRVGDAVNMSFDGPEKEYRIEHVESAI